MRNGQTTRNAFDGDTPGAGLISNRMNRGVMAMEGGWLMDVTPYTVRHPSGAERTVIAEGTTPGGAKVRIIGDAIVTDPEERHRIDQRIRAAIDQVNIGLMERSPRRAQAPEPTGA